MLFHCSRQDDGEIWRIEGRVSLKADHESRRGCRAGVVYVSSLSDRPKLEGVNAGQIMSSTERAVLSPVKPHDSGEADIAKGQRKGTRCFGVRGWLLKGTMLYHRSSAVVSDDDSRKALMVVDIDLAVTKILLQSMIHVLPIGTRGEV